MESHPTASARARRQLRCERLDVDRAVGDPYLPCPNRHSARCSRRAAAADVEAAAMKGALDLVAFDIAFRERTRPVRALIGNDEVARAELKHRIGGTVEMALHRHALAHIFNAAKPQPGRVDRHL